MMTLTDKRISPQGDVGLIFKIYLCDIAEASSISLSDEHNLYGWFDQTIAAQLLSKSFPSEMTGKLSKLS